MNPLTERQRKGFTRAIQFTTLTYIVPESDRLRFLSTYLFPEGHYLLHPDQEAFLTYHVSGVQVVFLESFLMSVSVVFTPTPPVFSADSQ